MRRGRVSSIIPAETRLDAAPLPGYEGLYEVTRSGHLCRVWNDGSRLVIRPRIIRGIPVVSVCHRGVRRIFRLHKLVAEQFVPRPPDAFCVAPLDGDRANTAAANLAWVSRSELYRITRQAVPICRMRPRRVVGVCQRTGTVVRFPSILASERGGFHGSSVSACCRGKSRQHAGYVWRYERGASRV